MYTNHIEPMFTQAIADGMTREKRELVQLSLSQVLINSLKRGYHQIANNLPVRQQLQHDAKPDRQVRCQESPQFC